MKTLRRGKRNRMVAGVSSGIGAYFDIDPVIVRVLMIIGFILTGFFPLVLLYVLMIAVVPSEDDVHHS